MWNPPILLCPADPEPAEEHSYVLNNHLADHDVKYSSKNLGGLTPSDVILMGALIYEAVMEQFGFRQLRVSTRGLRFAAVMD